MFNKMNMQETIDFIRSKDDKLENYTLEELEQIKQNMLDELLLRYIPMATINNINIGFETRDVLGKIKELKNNNGGI